jgi:5-(carboxyamino)imidazole ribonucleotide synthase
LPLGSTATILPAAMLNLLGEDGYTGEAKYEGLEDVIALEGCYVHLYGKAITKPFRKMGHVTVIDSTEKGLQEKLAFVKSRLKVIC